MKTPDLGIRSDKTVGKRIAANTGLLVGARGLGVVLGLATLLITAKALDNQVSFGTIIFLHGYMLFFAEVATFQSWQSIIRFGSDDVHNEDPKRLAGLVKFGIKIDVLSAILAYAGAIILFELYALIVAAYPTLAPQGSGFDVETLKPLVIAYSTVVLFQITGTPIGILRLFDKFNGLAFAGIVMPGIRLLGAIFAYFMGWGMIGFLSVWYVASVSGYVFKVALGFVELLKRRLAGSVLKAEDGFFRARPGLWSFVWKSNIDSTLAAGVNQLPILLVGATFGPAFVAIYKWAEEIAKLLSEGVKLLDQVIYPELARIVSGGEGRRILRLVTRASLVSLAVGMFLAGIVAVFGPFIIEGTLGAEYGGVVPLAVVLVIGAALFAAVAPLFPVFYAANRPEKAIYARALGLIVYVITFFIFTQYFGEIGSALAVVAGYFVGMILVVILTRQVLKGLEDRDVQTD
jgi:O-antigen/teichoic acid export membrane protein